MNCPLILIVEDDSRVRRFLVPLLEDQGYRVLSAGEGATGSRLARNHNPDLVLLDLGLPDQDGLDVLTDFRAWSRRPVVVLSARSQEKEKVRALDAGADDYLTKPFGAGRPCQTLTARLSGPTSRPSLRPPRKPPSSSAAALRR